MSLLITDAGIAASIQAAELGVSYKITHIAMGAAGYVPAHNQTTLRDEIVRKAITQGSVPTLGHLHFEVLFDGDVEYEAREIGYFLEDGTLFAVDSRNGDIISIKRSDTVITEVFDLTLSGSEINTITVEIIGAANATERVAGIAKITTNEKLAAGEDDLSIITPKKFHTQINKQTALDADIDNESDEPKFIQLPQFWRGVQKLVLDKLWLPLAELIYPVGCPIPYPSTEAPPKFIAYIGQPFDKSVFKKLAERFPSGIMPDMRKCYIRGLGDGEEVLSRKEQSVQPLGFRGNAMGPHGHAYSRQKKFSGNQHGKNPWTVNGYEGATTSSVSAGTPTGTITGTSDETNPNSIRWLYITRAA